MTGLAVVALGVGATLMFGGTAQAVVVGVSGISSCNGGTGQYGAVFSFSSGSGAPSLTLTSFVLTPPGTDIVGQFQPSPTIGPGPAEATATAVYAGTTTGTLAFAATYTDGVTPVTMNGTIGVAMDGTCTVGQLQVGASQAAPGDSVTISGTACGPAVVGADGWTVGGAVAFPTPLAFGPITAAANGTWSTQIVVPAATPPGSYTVSATCTQAFSANSASLSAQAVPLQAAPLFTYPTTATLTVVAPSVLAPPVLAPPQVTG